MAVGLDDVVVVVDAVALGVVAPGGVVVVVVVAAVDVAVAVASVVPVAVACVVELVDGTAVVVGGTVEYGLGFARANLSDCRVRHR